MIVGFLIGCYGGCVLSLPNLMNDSNGKASLTKQTKLTVIIVIGALMILVGQYIMTSPYSY